MSTPSPSAPSSALLTGKFLFERHIKPCLTPYHLVVAAVLGAITTVFGVLTVLLFLVVANLNILSWIE